MNDRFGEAAPQHALRDERRLWADFDRRSPSEAKGGKPTDGGAAMHPQQPEIAVVQSRVVDWV
jgi:hypothetical protein